MSSLSGHWWKWWKLFLWVDPTKSPVQCKQLLLPETSHVQNKDWSTTANQFHIKITRPPLQSLQTGAHQVKCSHLPHFITASGVKPKWEFSLGTEAYGIVLLHLHKSLDVITENIPGPYLSAGGEGVWAQGCEPRIPEFNAGVYQISHTIACVSLHVKYRGRRMRVPKLFTTIILA